MKKKLIILIFILMFMSDSKVSLAETENISTQLLDASSSELETVVDNYVNEYIGTTTAGATVVILRNGEMILNKAYGYADIESEIFVDQDTVFEWGSTTKLLVWTSIMQLEEKGNLDLDTDIREYLPDKFLKKLQYDTPITLYHLMNHNAGWEDRHTDLFYHSADDVLSLEETLRITEPTQIHEPGTVTAYSNYGTALAGYIVEMISGQLFHEYVNNNIFEVLGMADTSIHSSQEDNDSVAKRRNQIKGYKTNSNDELIMSDSERGYIGLYPAGSAIGTAEDAAKFISALTPSETKSSTLFSDSGTLERMLSTSNSAMERFPGVAHGFWERYYSERTVGHGGNTDSFSSYFTIVPDSQFAIVLFTNQASEEAISYGLINKLLGKHVPETAKEELPNAYEVEGNYVTARRAYNGFSKIYGLTQTYKVTAINNKTIEMFDDRFTQISPYVYSSEDNYMLYFRVEDGTVKRISMVYSDLLPLSSFEQNILVLCSVLLIICVIYIMVALLITLIQKIRNRKNPDSDIRARVFSLSLNIVGMITIINTIMLFIRTFQYSSYTALKIHFFINIIYILIVVLAVIYMFSISRKRNMYKMQRLQVIMSCTASILLAMIIIVFQLYY